MYSNYNFKGEFMTNNNIFILGLIYKQPNNAYELIKELNHYYVLGYKKIAESSIYVILKSLCEKGLLKGKIQKNTSYPEKTVYDITDLGKKELENALKKSIITIDFASNAFDIGVLFINIFSNEEIKLLLDVRIDKLTAKKNKLSKKSSFDSKIATALIESKLLETQNISNLYNFENSIK